jgi:hypothetical protein
VKWSDKNFKRHTLETLLLFVVAGSLNAYFSCRKCFWEPAFAIPLIAYSGSMWVLLWKGNELISCEIDKRISWLREPAKRFWIGIVFMLVFTVGAVAACSFIFMDFIFTREFSTSFSKSLIPVMIYSVGVTAFIMMIFLALQFLTAWRQAAINEEKLRRESIASQYEVLKNQVNPHFLFNTLNALSSLVYEDQAKAVQFINKFSEVYRYVLDSKDKEVVPVGDELEFVRSYFYLLQARYEDNLQVVFGEDMNAGYVPPMAIQMLVENAIKHNVIADGSTLRIIIKKAGDEIMIENNINLREGQAESSGLGIDNIKSRYSILSDMPVKVHRDDRVFRVSLPLLKLENP